METIEAFLASGDRGPNAAGTCLFLKADALRRTGEFAGAQSLFSKVITEYPNAKWDDPRIGATIRVRPKCQLGCRLAAERDSAVFPEDSAGYTALAWRYLNKKKLEMARMLATACIEEFQHVAKQQQVLHNQKYPEVLPKLPPSLNQAKKFFEQFWALYDVGTCWFIMGQSYQEEADGLTDRSDDGVKQARKCYDQAVRCYEEILKNYVGAQCFDPSGPWFWSVAKGAEEQKAIVLNKTAKLPKSGKSVP